MDVVRAIYTALKDGAIRRFAEDFSDRLFFCIYPTAMSKYEFVSVWMIDASLPAVWKAIRESKEWPTWWRGVISVVEISPGDAEGVGSVQRSTWKSALPYKLEFDTEIIRVERQKLIEARAFGELDGLGLWQFSETDQGVRVEYDWQVETSKRWMNLIAPLARPLFKWNHDVIMGWGETGLRKHLSGPAE